MSEKLFNTDSSDIEYLIQGLSPNHYVKIYDETGLNIITIENANLGGYNFFGYNPIIDTDSGTKMILNSNLNGWSRVYSLPGKLHQDYTSIVNEIRNDGLVLSNPYPNPSLEFTRIDYKLPIGINQAEIVFFNIHGQEIKRFIVERNFDFIEISTTDLPSGTYYFCLNTSQGISESKKMIKIK
jgi:hypothetical protein